jgi:pimeloyl-ACP methyl ester carboxylesterase
VTTLKRLTPTVLLFLVLVASCKPSQEPSLDKLIDVGTHSLYIHCLGTGRPTIVIDTGVGERYESWETIIATLGRQTRVCAYDRAGYGRSEPGPKPRDSQRAANELHLLLSNAGEDGPFILVGHSLGGLNMQVYANTHREETIALRQAADAARASTDPKESAMAAYLDATASEFEAFFGRTADEVSAIQSFGELPLTVIGATEPDPGFGETGPAFRQFWNEENQSLARKSASGQFILAEGSSHHIHLDTPQLVIDAILELVS